MKAVTLSRQGSKSDTNEDACLALPNKGLFVVADGVGGGPRGDLASRVVVETLYKELSKSDLNFKSIDKAIEKANVIVLEASKQSNLNGMASTLVLLWKTEEKVFC